MEFTRDKQGCDRGCNSRRSNFGSPVQHLLYQFGLIHQALAQGSLVQQQSIQQQVAPAVEGLLHVLSHVELWHLEDSQYVSPASGGGCGSWRTTFCLLLGVCQHRITNNKSVITPPGYRDVVFFRIQQLCHSLIQQLCHGVRPTAVVNWYVSRRLTAAPHSFSCRVAEESKSQHMRHTYMHILCVYKFTCPVLMDNL